MCFGRYKMEFYNRPSVRFRLSMQLLKAWGTRERRCCCGSVTWSPKQADRDRLQKVHHSMIDHDRLQKVHHSMIVPSVPRLAETSAWTPHPTLRPRACQHKTQRAPSGRRGADEGPCSRVVSGEMFGGRGWLVLRTGEGLDGAPRGRPEGTRH